MAEEAEIFRLEVDIVSSGESRDKTRGKKEEEASHGGRQAASGERVAATSAQASASGTGGARVRIAPPAPGSSSVAKPGGERPGGGAKIQKPSASEEKTDLLKRLKQLKSKAPKVDKNFFTNMASGTMRAIPWVGGALAFGFWEVMNAERLAALDEITGNTTNLGATIAAAREIKPRFEATAKTIGNIVEIGNAFGAIGDSPPAAAFGDLIPLLQKVNHAQALQQFDLKESLFRSAGSTVRKTLEESNKTQLVTDMIASLSEGMRK